VTSIATLIFTRYFFPFEVTSALLITAALGAMVLAHRERTSPKPTQRELSRQRVAGAHPTPLPGPGTYARHNAVDFPALLPDGTPSALSVSPVVHGRPGAREAVSEALREASGALPAGPEGADQSESPPQPGPTGVGQPAYSAGEDANGNGQNGGRS
jgi:NADH-quinone oxidoreductase subunit J